MSYKQLGATSAGITVKKAKIILFFVIFAAVMTFYYAKRYHNNNLNEINYIQNESNEKLAKIIQAPPAVSTKKIYFKNNTTTKYVLFWTVFFNHYDWVTGEKSEVGEEVLKSINCPVINCVFTHNHTLLSGVEKFDAIAFHAGEPFKITSFPSSRSPNQSYIMVSLESPIQTKGNLKRMDNFFNLTMTYRLDSDIEWDYGKIVDIETNEIIAPSQSPNWKMPDDDFYDENLMEIFNKKVSNIAWFVSHCFVSSNRHKLAKKINETMNIDVYGRCGKLQCSRQNQEVCYDLLESNYYFYLSFENSLCKDYVTEKLYHPLSKFVIPVVFNGANTTQFAPPKSYIDANDFENVDELVTYIQFLINNPVEYLKYFWWKKHYKVIRHPTYKYALCDVCKKLNDQTFMSKKHQYDDIYSWWNDKQCHKKSHINYK